MRESRLLVRHFFERFFDKESLSPQADPAVNLGPLLGILAAPAAFLAILLQPLTLLGWDLILFRYFFLSFTMTAMAFIVVLKWDALFPDLRDYQILTPLPLSTVKLFSTKLAALALFLAIFLIDLNLLGVLFWPGIDQREGALATMGAHALAMLAAGLFAALAAASVQGLLMTFLTARAFRRVVVYAQTLLMALLIMLLFLTPMIAAGMHSLVDARHPALYFFPGFWFVGLYERLRPATGNPLLLDLGGLGWEALACAAAIFLLTYVPNYRRHARRVIETPPADPRGPGRIRRRMGATLDRWPLKSPVERAVFHFIGQTITRSMKHRIFLAAYGGFGAALAVMTFASGRDGLLRLPLTLTFILVSALRAAFNFPSDLRANWAFQLTETDSAAEYVEAMRKWVVVCAVLPMFALLAPFEFVSFPAATALFHLAFGISLALLLIEIMFLGFRKAAFTCAYFPGRMNLVGLTVIYLFGFTMYSDAMAQLEAWLTGNIAWEAAFLIAAGAACWLLTKWRLRRLHLAGALDYRDEGDPAVRTMDLASR